MCRMRWRSYSRRLRVLRGSLQKQGRLEDEGERLGVRACERVRESEREFEESSELNAL